MSKIETFLSRILHTKNNMSYVPDVSMFPYWTNPLEKEHNEFVEKYDKIVNENDGLQQDHYTMSRKIRKLEEEKQELQEKVDEIVSQAQVIFQENLEYKKELNIITEAVENECQASGIMEVMNMRIEEAENKAIKQEQLKELAETNLKKEKECVIRLIGEVGSISDQFSNKGYSCCDECDCWEIHAEMESVKDNDWEEVLVCLECRDNNYTECYSCLEYVYTSNVSYCEDTQQHKCDNCNNSDNED